MWIVVLIIMGLLAFFIYKSKTNANKSSVLDVEKGVDEALHQGGMADTVLTERDKDQMYICMAMLSLKTGFTSARQMKNFVKLNVTDYNILALILSSFFMMQLYLYMDSILEERVQAKFPKKLADEIQTQIVLGRDFIIRLYEKLGYEESMIKKIANGSVLTYSKLRTPQNELLMQSLLNCHELYTNHTMELNDNISIGLFSLTTYTAMVPAYLSSMSRMIDHFYGYTLPIVDKLNANQQILARPPSFQRARADDMKSASAVQTGDAKAEFTSQVINNIEKFGDKMPSFQEEMYKESNSAALQYARNAIQFAFLLNGAAATALFAKSGTSFISSACIFAVGAAFATICMGGSYLVQMLIGETWRQAGEYIHFSFFGKIRIIPRMRVEWFRMFAILLWVASMVCFFYAAYKAASHVQ